MKGRIFRRFHLEGKLPSEEDEVIVKKTKSDVFPMCIYFPNCSVKYFHGGECNLELIKSCETRKYWDRFTKFLLLNPKTNLDERLREIYGRDYKMLGVGGKM